MMERHNVPPIRSGALTLLLALAAICLAVLAVLSLTTAQADLSLAQKSLDRFSQDAALENEGQPGLLVSIIMSLVGSLLVPVITWLFLRRDWASLN